MSGIAPSAAQDAINRGVVMAPRGASASVGVGAPWHASDIVLTGAPGPMADVGAGGVFIADIDGLGAVSASVAHHADSAS